MCAQTVQRKAVITGGGDPGQGSCTLEVTVDGAADVEVRGDTAVLRNLSGQPPQFRRFECSAPLPANPAAFRFHGVDGRGRQELVRGPGDGGPAVVRIQDPDGGAEGYTFALTWGDDRSWRGYPDRRGPGAWQQRDRRAGDTRFTTEEAVRACQDAVRAQSGRRFRTGNLAFRRTTLDDSPGPRDRVTGIVDVRRGYETDETYRFSCSVNFDTGEVRSVQIEPWQGRWHPTPGGGAVSNSPSIESCERAVEDRIRREGYRHVDFLSIDTGDRPGPNDAITGIARADRPFRSDSFDFRCGVDLRAGIVRSVDVRRR